MHPNTVDRQRLHQRRLSFGAGLAAAAEAAAADATPSCGALAAAAGLGSAAGRRGKPATPLDKLALQLEGEQAAALEVHASQAALAASLADADFGGSIPATLEEAALSTALSAEDEALLASMPQELRRMSTDGVISLDALRVGGAGGAAPWGSTAGVARWLRLASRGCACSGTRGVSHAPRFVQPPPYLCALPSADA